MLAKIRMAIGRIGIFTGTFVFPNLWGLHHDERYWEKPWEFNPSRFIEDGKVVAPDHEKKQRFVI